MFVESSRAMIAVLLLAAAAPFASAQSFAELASNDSASSSGEETLTASKSQRFAVFSATMRCSTLTEDARHTLTRTP